MKPDDCYLYFKGDREYVHSCEIFNSFISKVSCSQVIDIDFSISKKIMTCWTFEEIVSGKLDDVVGYIKISESLYKIVKNSNPIVVRKEYSESKVLQGISISGNGISHPNNDKSYSFIENLIISYKYLLSSQVFPGALHKYVFMRLVLDEIPKNSFMLCHRRRFGKKYLEALIFSEEEQVGKLYFLEE